MPTTTCSRLQGFANIFILIFYTIPPFSSNNTTHYHRITHPDAPNVPQKRPFRRITSNQPWVSCAFISSSWYQKKTELGIACLLRVQKDRGRALDHIDQEVVSWNYILGRIQASGAVDQVAVFVVAAVIAAVDVGSILAVEAGPFVVVGSGIGPRGTGPGQIQRYLGHRPCRFAHRTPVLYHGVNLGRT